MTPEEVVKATTESALKPFADLIEKLLGPAAEGVGEGFRSMIGPWVVKRQIRFWQRTREMIEEAGIEPQAVPPKLLLPILQNASLEDDDFLQDHWAALLRHASKESSKVLPAFLHTLGQLTRPDALFLKILMEKARSINPMEQNARLGDESALLEVFRKRFEGTYTARDFAIAKHNLLKLGVLTEEVDGRFRLTTLGVEFFRLVNHPRKVAGKRNPEGRSIRSDSKGVQPPNSSCCGITSAFYSAS